LKSSPAQTALIISFVAVLIYLGIIRTVLVSAADTPWLNNNHSHLINSGWFIDSSYGDCPSDSCDIWPLSILDCIGPDDHFGPVVDEYIVNDPPGLYYKHLSPNLSFSGESLLVGIYDSMCGTESGSLSVMVHPDIENIKLESMSVEERVEEFYLPFVLGATGFTTETLGTADLVPLYEAALNNCGTTGPNGKSAYRIFGNYYVIVQNWEAHLDCNIHVVYSLTGPTPTETPTDIPTPEFYCYLPVIHSTSGSASSSMNNHSLVLLGEWISNPEFASTIEPFQTGTPVPLIP